MRAVLDAITHVIVADDSQVVSLHATKDWEDPWQGPGVSVYVSEVPL